MTPRRLPTHLALTALPTLEIIANFGVGVDAINLDDAKERGIIVTNTPDVLNETVADTALGLIMNTVRKFPQAEQYLRAGHWAARGPAGFRSPRSPPGRSGRCRRRRRGSPRARGRRP